MDDDLLLRWPEIAKLTKLSRSTVDRLEKLGRFPKRVNIGTRAIAWKRGDIEGWLAKLSTQSATQDRPPH